MRTFTATLCCLLLLFSLTACKDGDTTPAGSAPSEILVTAAPSSSAATPSSSQASSSVPRAAGAPSASTPLGLENGFINAELLAILGQPLSALDAQYQADYFTYPVSWFTGAVESYDPYICFLFDPWDFFGDGSGQTPPSTESPFTRSDLVVDTIFLQADLDPATATVHSQASLRRLFQANEPITYALLATHLGQSPTLEHDPAGGWTAISPHEIGGGYTEVAGGTYTAGYTLQGASLQITYVYDGENHQAVAASLSIRELAQK